MGLPIVEINSSIRILEENGQIRIEHHQLGPLVIDFIQDAAHYRRRNPLGKNDLLAKALGWSKGNRQVIDATLGLAEDAVFMAQLGFVVTGIEQNPYLYRVLAQSLQQAKDWIQHASLIATASLAENHHEPVNTSEVLLNEPAVIKNQFQYLERLQWLNGDSIQLLPEIKDADVIYLDPMFPEKKKSSLPRKEMQIFKSLIGEPQNEIQLLEVALSVAKDRVVVKRPLIGPAIGSEESKPKHRITHSFLGKAIRYDMYSVRG